MVAVWWLLFTIPCLLWVREQKPPRPLAARDALRAGWREFRATLHEVRKYRPLVWFLLAYWLYIDGVNTIIKMAVDYGLSLGFPQQSLIAALAHRAVRGISRRRWRSAGSATASARATASSSRSRSMPRPPLARTCIREVQHFYLLAVMIGLVQGGIQSLSRSYYASLVPEGKQGEFFGFYNMMGKFAAVLGPTLVGVTALLTGDTRIGMLSVLVLFVGGAVVLSRVRAP